MIHQLLVHLGQLASCELDQTDLLSGGVLITETSGGRVPGDVCRGWELDMAGCADSWSVWLKEHGAALVLLARHWVASQADAEDVVQEAFVRFWRSQERIEEPVAYLYACVKHCALDWHRGQRRRERRELAVACPEAASLFEAAIEQDERRLVIETALRQLPTNQAEVLVMKIWGGLTFPQIAAALGISANTAASRYRYALAKLREQLAAEVLL
jgi:RNA polymerase sigma-70 factor (ECF subfamily)